MKQEVAGAETGEMSSGSLMKSLNLILFVGLEWPEKSGVLL